MLHAVTPLLEELVRSQSHYVYKMSLEIVYYLLLKGAKISPEAFSGVRNLQTILKTYETRDVSESLSTSLICVQYCKITDFLSVGWTGILCNQFNIELL